MLIYAKTIKSECYFLLLMSNYKIVRHNAQVDNTENMTICLAVRIVKSERCFNKNNFRNKPIDASSKNCFVDVQHPLVEI